MKEDKEVQKFDIDEIKKLSEKAGSQMGFDLGFDEEDLIDEKQIEFISDTQNPDVSHKLYYSIESILRATLPKGEENKKLREFVREEKKIFLNRGHRIDETGRRNSDSRQSYISSHLEIALINVLQWVKEGGNAFELFLKFRKLNTEYGYLSSDDEDQVKGSNKL